MHSMDGVAISDDVLMKADQTRTLACLNRKVNVGGKMVYIDSSVQLLVSDELMMERTSDMESCFSFELTAIPTALITDNGLRKTDKSALAKINTEKYEYI